MGDIKSAEAFVDVVFITATGGTTGVAGLTPTCTSVKAADNTRTACVVASLGSGWYTATVTANADGTWMTEWAISGSYTIHYPYKMFKVGGGVLADAVADTAELQGDWTDGGRLDTILDAIKAKTDNLPTDPADDSDLDTAIADVEGKVDDLEGRLTAARAGYLDYLASGTYGLSALKTLIDTVDGYFDVPTADAVTDATVRDIVGRKTDTANTTVGATSSLMRYVKGILNQINIGIATDTLVSHSITPANDKTETTVSEISESGIYKLSIFVDCDALETAGEGGTVTFKLYNKIDGSNYSDVPSARVDYVVGGETEYPSFEVNMLHGYSKLTVRCSSDVTGTRTLPVRVIVKDEGA